MKHKGKSDKIDATLQAFELPACVIACGTSLGLDLTSDLPSDCVELGLLTACVDENSLCDVTIVGGCEGGDEDYGEAGDAPSIAPSDAPSVAPSDDDNDDGYYDSADFPLCFIECADAQGLDLDSEDMPLCDEVAEVFKCASESVNCSDEEMLIIDSMSGPVTEEACSEGNDDAGDDDYDDDYDDAGEGDVLNGFALPFPLPNCGEVSDSTLSSFFDLFFPQTVPLLLLIPASRLFSSLLLFSLQLFSL